MSANLARPGTPIVWVNKRLIKIRAQVAYWELDSLLVVCDSREGAAQQNQQRFASQK
jgi:hypothetical protein